MAGGRRFAAGGSPCAARSLQRDDFVVLPTGMVVTPSASSVRVRDCEHCVERRGFTPSVYGSRRLGTPSTRFFGNRTHRVHRDLIRAASSTCAKPVQPRADSQAGGRSAPRTTTPPEPPRRDDLRAPQALILVTASRHHACGSRAESSLRYAHPVTSSTTRTSRNALRASWSPRARRSPRATATPTVETPTEREPWRIPLRGPVPDLRVAARSAE